MSLSELNTFSNSVVQDSSAIFSSTKHHLWRDNASKSKEWFATDVPRRKNEEYSGGPISYNFNSDGYRCDELGESDFLFLGCSYTFGVGLPVDDCWAKIVADASGVPYQNVSWPGAGSQYMLRTTSKVISKVKPKVIMALMPYNFRMELVNSDGSLGVFTKTAGMINLLPPKDRDRMNAYMMFTTKEQEDFMLLSNMMAIEALATAYGSRLIWSDWTYSEPRSEYYTEHAKLIGEYKQTTIMDNHTRWTDLSKKARDSTHPASEFHKQLADVFLGAL